MENWDLYTDTLIFSDAQTSLYVVSLFVCRKLIPYQWLAHCFSFLWSEDYVILCLHMLCEMQHQQSPSMSPDFTLICLIMWLWFQFSEGWHRLCVPLYSGSPVKFRLWLYFRVFTSHNRGLSKVLWIEFELGTLHRFYRIFFFYLIWNCYCVRLTYFGGS